MDGSLPGNHKFRLNEGTSSLNDGKMHIFVKLTDSCMKTIETYLKSNKKQNLSTKPIIKFNQNGGEISIPTNNGERKAYSFQISPEDKTPEVFECIKQINRDQLETCGSIEQKINIHAQEDVYSMTRTKVTEFQKIEEQTKKQTKEIGESSKTILEKRTNKSSHSRPSTQINNPRQQKTTINQDHHLSPNTNNQSLSSERPLRERLIHLLAAKPYKKPELLVRLRHDGGIRDDEREQLDSILSSISTQSLSGDYHLLKNILTSGEVNYDWSFYPKGEASIVRRKIKDLQANASRTNNTKSTNDSASTSSNGNRLSLPNPIPKGPTPNSTSSTTSSSTTKVNVPSSSSSSSSTYSTNRPTTTTSDERNHLEKEEIISSNPNPLSDERMQQLSNMLDKLTNAMAQSEKSHEELISENEPLNENDLDEAEKEYNRLVPEYNHLIDYLKTVSDKFQSLQQQWNEEQNSEKAKKIVDEFFKCENNDQFLSKRQRLLQLHMKLNHLQKLLEKTSPLNDLNISDDDDDHY